MFSVLVVAVLSGLAAFVFATVVVACGRRPVFIVYALLAVHFWELLGSIPSVHISGIGLGPLDGANLVAFGAAIIRMRPPRGLQWPLIGVVVMVLIAVARAVLSFGDGNALLGFRTELYFIVPALFASTLKPPDVAAALRGVWRFGFWMAVVAIGRWFLPAIGIDIGPVPNPGDYEIPRVINSGATLAVAMAATIGAWRWLHDRTSRWHEPWVILAMLLVVLLAQNRSVWVVTAAMLFIIFVGTKARLWLRASVAIAIVTFIALVELLGPGHTAAIGDSLGHAASDAGTWTWRLQRWHEVWSTHAARGPFAIAFGSGYGHSWVSGAVGVWEVSPHNGFIQIAVRIGLAGGLLLFGTYAAVIIRLGHAKDATSRIVRILTIGVLLYFVPYYESIFSGLLLGIAAAVAMNGTTARTFRRTKGFRFSETGLHVDASP